MKDKPNILKSDFSSSKTHSFQHQLQQSYLIGQMEEAKFFNIKSFKRPLTEIYCVFKIQFRLRVNLFLQVKYFGTFWVETWIFSRTSLKKSAMYKRERVGPKRESWGTHLEDKFLFKWIRSPLPLRNDELW